MVPYFSAIYAIRNTVNGHMYIGSAEYCVKRMTRHKWELNRGTHHSKHLQRAYAKYGKDAFDFSVVEYVDDKEKLLQREQIWLDFFKPAYNTAKFAGSPTRGLKFSPETRAKMSAAHMGKKRPPRTEEWKAKISATKKERGMSEEGLASMRKKRAALFQDPEYREKWAAVRRGRIPSAETRAKLSLALMGNQRSKGFKYPPGAYSSRRKIQRRVS